MKNIPLTLHCVICFLGLGPRRQMALGAVIIAGLTLTACTLSPSNPVPALTVYSLQTSSVAQINDHAEASTDLSLLIVDPTTAPGYQTADIIYVNDPPALQHFSKSRWVAPPANLLVPVIAQTIHNQAYFSYVITPPYHYPADYVLNIHLLELQQDFTQQPSIVRLSMQVDLVSYDKQTLIASQIVTHAASAKQENAYGGVMTASELAERMAEDISEFVIRHSQPLFR